MKLEDLTARPRSLVGRVPVEPLDDERMTNIERRIVAGAADAASQRTFAASPSRLSFVLAAAMAAVVVVAGFAGWRLRGGAGEPAIVAEAAPLTIHTDGDRSTIDIGDARIASSPATAFAVTRPDGGVLVALARGKVELEVGKRSDRPPLVVRAGDTDVVVIGTRFSVDFGDGSGPVEVRVTEGVVKVVRHRQETRVAAGEAWRTAEGKLALVALDTPRSSSPTGEDPGSDIEIDVATGPEVALHDRVARVPDAVPGRTSNGPARTPRTTEVRRTRPLDNPSEPYFDLKQRIRARPVLPAHDLGITDPQRAIDEHWKSAVRTGAEASRALYSIAVVQAQKLNRPGDALRTLEQYRKRFVGGTEYESALWLRVRILCLARLDDECRKAAHTYVSAATDSAKREIAEQITTTRLDR
jgi:hypothetical protein